jgi:lipopolysaccharide transport system ATP-binding protein
MWRGVGRRLNGDGEWVANGTGRDSSFWALSNVSFEVEPGEVVGIFGRNGAGKSTLLKILSRITEPTDGHIEVRGRMGSLLEVGTGFHPELSGRENIFLNGSLLGMRRTEINRKFDEIVAFSEIEKFLETPVKRYSSGMYVRLAFAVAAHLEPEILIVDEVLAVGDLAFQAKCLGKMHEVGKTGRTVLFVSHNMAAIKALCARGIYLSRGELAMDSGIDEAIDRYTADLIDPTANFRDLRAHPRRESDSRPVMTGICLSDGEGGPTSTIPMGGALTIQVSFETPEERISPVLGVVVKDRYGAGIFGINNRIVPGFDFNKPMEKGIIRCHYDHVPLMPGIYTIDLYFGDKLNDIDVIHNAISFEVLADDVFGSGRIPPSNAGSVFLRASWTVESE